MQQSCLLDFGPIQRGASYPRVEGRVSRESPSSVNTQHWTPVTRHSFVKASSKIISLSPIVFTALAGAQRQKQKFRSAIFFCRPTHFACCFPSDLLTANKVFVSPPAKGGRNHPAQHQTANIHLSSSPQVRLSDCVLECGWPFTSAFAHNIASRFEFPPKATLIFRAPEGKIHTRIELKRRLRPISRPS
jgi:hypothetical protein